MRIILFRVYSEQGSKDGNYKSCDFSCMRALNLILNIQIKRIIKIF